TQSRFGSEVGSDFVLRCNAPFFDAGTRCDPFVRGLDDFFQFVIGQHLGRYISAHSSDGNTAALKVVIGARVFELRFSDRTHAERGVAPAAAIRSLARAMSLAMVC